MNNGKGTPCVPDHYLKKYRKDFDRPCPQIILYPINEDARTILICSLNENTRAFIPGLFSILEKNNVDLLPVIDRCMIALNSKRFATALDKHRKQNG